MWTNPLVSDPYALYAVVPAAGMGRRMQGDIPKQYLTVAGKTVIQHSLEKLLCIKDIQHIVLVVGADDERWQSLPILNNSRISVTTGGRSRSQSVRKGLQFLEKYYRYSDDSGRSCEAMTEDRWQRSMTLVHDVARPCVASSDIEKLIDTVQGRSCGGILAVPTSDTVKQVDDDHAIRATIDRSHLWLAQTPQLFPTAILLGALLQAENNQVEVTDEASAMEVAGYKPVVVAGSPNNIKITRPEDLAYAHFILSGGLGS